MADTQNYRLKGHLGSLNSFIDPPSEPVLDASPLASVPKSTTEPKIQNTPSSSSSRSTTNRISHSSATSALPSSSPLTPSINSSSSSSSEKPFATFPPGVIYTGDQSARKDTTFKEDGLQHHHSNKTHINWFYPLLAVLGILAILTLAIYFYVEKKRRKASVAPHRHVKWSPDENQQHPEHGQSQQKTMGRYPSWSNYSIATTNTILNNSKSTLGNSNDIKTSIPPPAYTPHTKQEKRLTSDTLVEPASLVMLKTQYSPQLAFSPSLVAGEFQQQQQEMEAFPTELLDQKNLVANAISPSNTLIDNSSILSTSSLDKQQQQQQQQQQNERPRIEIYDPQINIPEDDEEEEEEEEEPANPFNPYRSNNKEDQNPPPNHLSVHVSLPNVYENEK